VLVINHKISRVKKAGKWTGYANDTVRMGIDTAAYGYKDYQKAKNLIGSEIKSWFGGGDMEVEGAKISMSAIKKSYNKNVKNTKLGKALKETAGNAIGDVYDKGTEMIGNTKHLSGIAGVLKKGKKVMYPNLLNCLV
jgi:actin-like ATPase involved in cell morphogenesis